VVVLAKPPERSPLPSVVVPSAKVTVPVGVPAPGARAPTLAVRTTGCPKTAGFALGVSPVDVDATSTSWLKVPELPRKEVLSLV
jgi:hypothetical protein